jgi:signal peptidase I
MDEQKIKISGEPKAAGSPPAGGKSRGDWAILFHDLVYILAAVVLVFTFFVRMSRVEGDSMNPTLVNHDRMLLLSNVWYTSPQRGDIVVARIPEFSKDPIVKRVIAVEGDTVYIDFDNGVVYVNGVALDEPYVKEPTYRSFELDGMTYPMVIEKGHVFLMGDNRNDSYDSRYGIIGQVDQRCILGKAFFITLPGKDSETGNRDLSRFGLID